MSCVQRTLNNHACMQSAATLKVADNRCYAYVDMREEYFTLRKRKFKSACGKCEGREERK
ncbi:unnamed protein product [Sphenostylis stenocarpa]|uniref:Uncharacterized protein n=1 Tax=Sphenostylis stenocarpa TaxID=92480 RepID=A0AA86STG7_9FABA|nr:unnamed protein product [Sphenostylis stenocarpa]